MKGKYQKLVLLFLLAANDFTEKMFSWLLHIHSLSAFLFPENKRKKASELTTNYKKQKTGLQILQQNLWGGGWGWEA